MNCHNKKRVVFSVKCNKKVKKIPKKYWWDGNVIFVD